MKEFENPYPLQGHLGYYVKEWEKGRSVVTMELKDYHMNRHGIPHGGLYATLLDTCMGLAGSFAEEDEEKRYALTLNLTTNFLSRPLGKVLSAEGFVTGGGKSTFFSEGKITDETGELIATAIGTFRIRQTYKPKT